MTTVETRCKGRARRRRAGTHSSSSRRIGRQSFLRRFEQGYGSLPGHRRKVLQKFFQGRGSFKVIKKVLDWHSGTREAQRSAHDLRVALDKGCIHGHLLLASLLGGHAAALRSGASARGRDHPYPGTDTVKRRHNREPTRPGWAAPRMSLVVGLWPPAPPLFRYAAHPDLIGGGCVSLRGLKVRDHGRRVPRCGMAT